MSTEEGHPNMQLLVNHEGDEVAIYLGNGPTLLLLRKCQPGCVIEFLNDLAVHFGQAVDALMDTFDP